MQAWHNGKALVPRDAGLVDPAERRVRIVVVHEVLAVLVLEPVEWTMRACLRRRGGHLRPILDGVRGRTAPPWAGRPA
jgi:hypothetical protein